VSVSVSVFLKQGTMPTPAVWQEALRRHGFDLKLDDFDPASHSGFLPAQYRGRPAGFEFYRDIIEDPDDLGSDECAQAAADYDEYVSLVTHSNIYEALSATVAAGVLAELTGGLLWQDESGEGHPPEKAVPWARAVEREALASL
jgi:hypothetical protein